MTGSDDPPLWVRVVNELLERIGCGALKPGDEVPSRKELAAGLDVSPDTVSQAMGYLAGKRIVRLDARSRYIVTGTACARAAGVASAGIPAEMRGRRGRPEVTVSPELAALVIEACTRGGMTRTHAGTAYGIGRRVVSRVLREHGGILRPGEAAALAGIRPERLRYLARTGAVRRVSCSGEGRWMYFRDDMLELAGRAGTAPRRETGRDDLDGTGTRLGRAMRRARTERGMRPAEMAVLLGLDPSAVSRIERGERRSTRMRAAGVAKALGITVEELLAPCPHCRYEPPAGYQCLRCGTLGPDWDAPGQHAEAAAS